MAGHLSEDLRIRVIRAVAGGMSRRAAERFGVSPTSAVRFERSGTPAKLRGQSRKAGDQRSHRIEAHRTIIMGAIKAKPDITLVEIAEMPLILIVAAHTRNFEERAPRARAGSTRS